LLNSSAIAGSLFYSSFVLPSFWEHYAKVLFGNIYEMRVVALSTLREFWENPDHEDSKDALNAWYREAKQAEWVSPADIKAQYRNASILKRGRVVFNIAGNKYRLIVSINFATQTIFIKFIGTHSQYDKIDAETYDKFAD
jgi:mRNA interferase HigB